MYRGWVCTLFGKESPNHLREMPMPMLVRVGERTLVPLVKPRREPSLKAWVHLGTLVQETIFYLRNSRRGVLSTCFENVFTRYFTRNL